MKAPTYAIGLLICKIPFFINYKLRLLSTWRKSEGRSRLDDFLFTPVFSSWINFEWLREKDPDKREKMKALAMGGESGKKWAESYNLQPLDFSFKIGSMNLNQVKPLFSLLTSILKENKGITVVQIGSSSGREIAHFAKNYYGNRYIGTDIYKEIITYSSSMHRYNNLSFELVSAINIDKILDKYQNDKIIVFSSGSLQYVQPEHLHIFFAKLKKYNLQVVINDVGSNMFGDPDKIKGSKFRSDFSYIHNYRYYAEKNEFHTLDSEKIMPFVPRKNYPRHNDVVHYFYYGKTTICSWKINE